MVCFKKLAVSFAPLSSPAANATSHTFDTCLVREELPQKIERERSVTQEPRLTARSNDQVRALRGGRFTLVLEIYLDRTKTKRKEKRLF